MPNWLKKRPWLYIVFAFVILIAIWTKFIMIAVKNQPEKIEPEEVQTGKGEDDARS